MIPFSPSMTDTERYSERRKAALLAAAVYFMLVVALKMSVRDAGWAASDADRFHFPVVNYFLANGFTPDYPNLLAMFPGMHIFFAAVARLFGVSSLAYNGTAAFLIQCIWGMAFLYAIVRLLTSVCLDRTQVAIAALMIFSSSYTLFSWLWPTTELATMTCFAAMLAVLAAHSGYTSKQRLVFSLATIVATLIRQNSATLSAAMLLSGRATAGETSPARRVLANSLPVLAGAVILSLLVWHWKGLVPPGFQHHRSHGLNWVAEIHAVALSGLIAWPLAGTTVRALGSTNMKLLALSVAAAVVATTVCCAILPLDYSFEQGRWGSFVWDLEAKLGRGGKWFMVACITVGFLIWFGAAALSWQQRFLKPEIVLFGCFMAGFLAQALSWQRYIESELLLTLAVFFAPVFDSRRVESAVVAVWFGLYAALSLGKAAFGLSAA